MADQRNPNEYRQMYPPNFPPQNAGKFVASHSSICPRFGESWTLTSNRVVNVGAEQLAS